MNLSRQINRDHFAGRKAARLLELATSLSKRSVYDDKLDIGPHEDGEGFDLEYYDLEHVSDIGIVVEVRVSSGMYECYLIPNGNGGDEADITRLVEALPLDFTIEQLIDRLRSYAQLL